MSGFAKEKDLSGVAVARVKLYIPLAGSNTSPVVAVALLAGSIWLNLYRRTPPRTSKGWDEPTASHPREVAGSTPKTSG